MNTINLSIRFILEVVAFITPAFYIATLTEGYLSIILPLLSTLTLAAIWGIFAVKGDPSRSGKTVINTPGWIRLLLEFAIFGFGIFSFIQLNLPELAWGFAMAVLIHNGMCWERNAWLLKQ